jgi:MFS family permease
MTGATPPAARMRPFALLGEAPFRNIWIAGSCVGVMRWLELLAVGIHVLQVTGSPLLVALFTLLRMFPMALFGAVIGAFAERVPRRSLLVFGLVTMTLQSALIAGLLVSGREALWPLAIASFLAGLFWAADFPVRRTLLGEIAGQDRLGPAMGLESMTMNATRALGPPLGGLLLEIFGLAGAFVLGMALYGLSAVLIRRIPVGVRAEGGGGRLFAQVVDGLRHLRGARMIVAILAVTVLLNMFGFSYVALVPVMGEQVMGLGPFPTGLLMAAEGTGGLVGALVIAWRAKPEQHARIYAGGSGAFLFAVLLFAQMRSLAPAIAVQLGAGLGLACFGTMQSALILRVSPPHLRGRMMGLLTMCIGTGPLGMLHQGLLADWFGAPTALTVSALEGLACLAVVVTLYPELLRVVPTTPPETSIERT